MQNVSPKQIRRRPQPVSPGFVDLSHVLEEGMPVYPGLPTPVFGAILSHRQSRSRYKGKAEFHIGKVDMPTNLGTYIDAPFHRFSHLEDLSRIALELIAGVPALVVDAPIGSGPLSVPLERRSIRDRALLIRTGWDARWGTTEYWEPGPYLSEDSVDGILRAGPRLVGVDFWNVDDPTDDSRPAHTRLLREGILIVENLCNLSGLPHNGFRFFAVPPAIVRGASFPVRAFAEILV